MNSRKIKLTAACVLPWIPRFFNTWWNLESVVVSSKLFATFLIRSFVSSEVGRTTRPIFDHEIYSMVGVWLGVIEISIPIEYHKSNGLSVLFFFLWSKIPHRGEDRCSLLSWTRTMYPLIQRQWSQFIERAKFTFTRRICLLTYAGATDCRIYCWIYYQFVWPSKWLVLPSFILLFFMCTKNPRTQYQTKFRRTLSTCHWTMKYALH